MTELVRAGNESANIAWLLPKAINKQAATLPAHLFKLPGGDWAVWRWMALRGAGFPASEVLKLAAPECAAAADTQKLQRHLGWKSCTTLDAGLRLQWEWQRAQLESA